MAIQSSQNRVYYRDTMVRQEQIKEPSPYRDKVFKKVMKYSDKISRLERLSEKNVFSRLKGTIWYTMKIWVFYILFGLIATTGVYYFFDYLGLPEVYEYVLPLFTKALFGLLGVVCVLQWLIAANRNEIYNRIDKLYDKMYTIIDKHANQYQEHIYVINTEHRIHLAGYENTRYNTEVLK